MVDLQHGKIYPVARGIADLPRGKGQTPNHFMPAHGPMTSIGPYKCFAMFAVGHVFGEFCARQRDAEDAVPYCGARYITRFACSLQQSLGVVR